MTKYYANEYEDEFIVEELTRKEFVESALWTIGAIEDGDPDSCIWVEYADGKVFSMDDCSGARGKFRKVGIVFGVLGNAATWQVFGKYAMDVNMVPQRAPERSCHA